MSQGKWMIDRGSDEKQKFRPERTSRKAVIDRLNRGIQFHKDRKRLADNTHSHIAQRRDKC